MLLLDQIWLDFRLLDDWRLRLRLWRPVMMVRRTARRQTRRRDQRRLPLCIVRTVRTVRRRVTVRTMRRDGQQFVVVQRRRLMHAGRMMMRGDQILSFLSSGHAGAGARMVRRHHGGALLAPLWRRRWYRVRYRSVRIWRERGIPSDRGVPWVRVGMIRVHGSKQRMVHQRMMRMERMGHVRAWLLRGMHHRLRN